MTAVPMTAQLRGALGDLRPAMRRVAEHVLADPGSAAAMTITDLARAAGTSEATVIRLCRQIGVPGYTQFRLALASEMGARERPDARPTPSGDIVPGDDLAAVIEKIAFADARAVEDTARALSVAELEAVVNVLVAAPRVDVYGVGASALVAADLQQKLHRIGRVAFAFPDAHLALASAALLGPGDAAIAISHSGATIDTLDVLRTAADQGATTIALTNAPRSPLARAADHVLTTSARETTFRSGATASRLAQLTVVDCVFVAVAQRTFEQSQAALERTYSIVNNHRTRQPR